MGVPLLKKNQKNQEIQKLKSKLITNQCSGTPCTRGTYLLAYYSLVQFFAHKMVKTEENFFNKQACGHVGCWRK